MAITISVNPAATDLENTDDPTFAITPVTDDTALILLIYIDDTTEGDFTSVSDNQSNVYNAGGTFTNGNQKCLMYWVASPVVAATTITVVTTAATDTHLKAFTLQGTATASIVDVTNSSTGTDSAPSTSITPNATDAGAIVWFAGQVTNSGLTSLGTGQTDLGTTTNGGAEKHACARSIEIYTAAPGAQSAVLTKSAAWVGCAYEIKAAGADLVEIIPPETVQRTEGVIIFRGINRFQDEDVQWSDDEQVSRAIHREQIDTVQRTEPGNVVSRFITRFQDEAINWLSELIPNVNIKREVDETINRSEDIERARGRVKEETEAVNRDEDIDQLRSRFKFIPETIQRVEDLPIARNIARFIDTVVQRAEDLQFDRNILRFIPETIQWSEIASPNFARLQIVTEIVKRIEQAIIIAPRIIESIVERSEGIVKLVVASGVNIVKFVNESVNRSEDPLIHRGLNRLIPETIQWSDARQVSRIVTRFVNETVQRLEGIQVSRIVTRIIDSTVNRAEGPLIARGLNRIRDSTVQWSDEILSFLGIAKVVDERVFRQEARDVQFSGLISRFKANDTALDTEGANNGTWAGSETYADGQLGRAFDLDGSSKIAIANEGNFDFDDDDAFSVACWLKPNTPASGLPQLVAKIDVDAGPGWLMYWHKSFATISFILKDAGINHEHLAPSNAAPDGEWTHACVTYSGNSNDSGKKIYINGVFSTQDGGGEVVASILNDFPVHIGGRDDENKKFDGLIDDVQIYNRELTSAEIFELGNKLPRAFGLGRLVNETVNRLSTAASIQVSRIITRIVPETVNRAEDIVKKVTSIIVNIVKAINETIAWSEPKLSTFSSLVTRIAFDGDLLDQEGSNNGSVPRGVETYGEGVMGRGFFYDGSTAVELANESNFDREHNQALSISIWVRLDANPGNSHYIVTKSAGTSAPGLTFFQNGSDGGWRFRFESEDTAIQAADGTHDLTLGQWHHMAATYDGSSNQSGMKIYKDGKLITTVSPEVMTATILTDNPVRIGARFGPTGSTDWEGALDDFQWYNKELSAEEVRILSRRVLRTRGLNRLVSETVNRSEDPLIVRAINRMVNETVNWVKSIDPVIGLHVIINETREIAEGLRLTIIKGVEGIIERFEHIQVSRAIVRFVPETVNWSEFPQFTAGIHKFVNETVQWATLPIPSRAITKFVNDTVNWVEDIKVSRIVTRFVNEIVSWFEPEDIIYDNLQAHLKFNGDLLDSSGNNNNGTAFGGPTIVESIMGQGMKFVSAGTAVDLDNETNFDKEVTDTFSTTAWVKFTAAPSANDGFVCKGAGIASSRGWYFFSNDGRLFCNLFDVVDVSEIRVRAADVGRNLSDQDWHHIACTYDGSKTGAGIKIYIDGIEGTESPQLDNLASDASILTDVPVTIGNTSAHNVSGDVIMDEVQIYDDILTPDEIWRQAQKVVRARGLARIQTEIEQRLEPADAQFDNLELRVRLDDKAVDTSGQGHTVTWAGTSVEVYEDSPSPTGRGATLTGQGDGGEDIFIGEENDFDKTPTDPFSVAFWVRMTTLGQVNAGLVTKSNSPVCRGWQTRINNNAIFFQLVDVFNSIEIRTFINLSQLPSAPLTNKWIHVCWTYDGSTKAAGVRLYVNGVRVDNLAVAASGDSLLAGSNTVNANEVSIGGFDSDATGNELNGSISDVHIYNDVLTAGEAKILGYRPKVSRTLTRFVPETIEWGEGIFVFNTIIRFVNETVNRLEEALITRGLNRLIPETVNRLENLLVIRAITRFVEETVQWAEEVLRFIVSEGAVVRIIPEIVQRVEDIKVIRAITRLIPETINWSEVVQVSRSITRFIPETINWIQNIQVSRIITRMQDSTVQWSDFVQKTLGINKLIPETVNWISDFKSALGIAKVVPAEEVQRLEDIKTSRRLTRFVEEVVQRVEDIKVSRLITRFTDEVVQWAEAIQVSRSISRLVPEIVQRIENLLVVRNLNRLIPETINWQENIDKLRARLRLVPETINWASDFKSALGIAVTIPTDEVQRVEDVKTSRGLVRLIEEVIEWGRFELVVRALVRMINESVNRVEDVQVSRSITRFVDEVVQRLEDTIIHRGLNRLVPETVQRIEGFINVLGLIRLVPDTVQWSEDIKKTLMKVRFIDEAVNRLEEVQVNRVVTRLIPETIQRVEAILLVRSITRFVNEIVQRIEDITISRSLRRQVGETVQWLEGPIISVGLSRLVPEVVQRLEDIKTAFGLAITVPSDIVQRLEDTKILKGINKTVDEIVEWGREERILRALVRMINEQVQRVEDIQVDRNILRFVNETVRRIESIQITRFITRFIPETVNRSEVVIKARTLLRLIPETVQWIDNPFAFVPGDVKRFVNETVEWSEETIKKTLVVIVHKAKVKISTYSTKALIAKRTVKAKTSTFATKAQVSLRNIKTQVSKYIAKARIKRG